ncbi:carbohydrate binding domain-containing protein, partial [Thermococcus sp.]|uniref:carbohydrate binding domain-containing protein n=1 Tax=Thermococcus sp. TaxID=35749 RepID=UPI002616D3D8
HYTIHYQPNRWSRAYITDPHHGIWHNFINGFPNQKWEFSYGISTGFAFIVYGNDTLEIPINVKNNSNYQIFIRVLKSTKGGKVQINIDNLSKTIDTKDLTKAEFVWVNLGRIHLKRGKYILKIKNIYGSNAINLIVIIPSKKFDEIENEVKNILSRKRVVYIINGREDIYYNPRGFGIFKLNIIKNGTYKLAVDSSHQVNITIDNTTVQVNNKIKNLFYSKLINLTSGHIFIKIPIYTNLVKNPSFEEGLKYWSKPKQGFHVEIDNSTSYYGKYSLKVITNSTKRGWSWIYQEVNVQPNTKYIIETHIKYQNVEESHIAIDVYNAKTKSWNRVGALPSARDGTSNWQTFKMILKTNPYITKIRIILNAGWVKDPSKGEAITWFDGITVYKSTNKIKDVIIFPVSKANETLNDLFKTNETPATVQNYRKINPTLWKVKVNATKPFFLTFAESYDPLWEARVYKDGKLVEKVHPVPVYGVINGFWINQTGNLEIVLRYTPQNWFERGLIISLTTFILSILYLFYDWRREKGDRWAKRLEKKIKNMVTSLKSRIGGVLRR